MYTDNDLKSSTIIELPNEAVEKIAGDVTLSSSKATCSDLKHNIDFVVEKCEYYKAIRSDQNIIRNDFKVVYNFNYVNINGSSALVDVNESINFYYDGIDIQTAIITNYNVSLYKTNDQWYITDIASDDPFDGMKKNTDFNAADAIADYNSAKKQSAVKSDATVELEVPEPVERSVVSSIRGYNNASAWKYAYTYSTQGSTNQTSFYNSKFNSLSADCQNFTSQCVWAGFGGDNTLNSINNALTPMDNVGNGTYSRWYAKPTTTYWAWTACSFFREYLKNSANDTGKRLTANIYDVAGSATTIPTTTGELVGSIMHVWGSAGAYEHAIVITTANSRSRSDIYFCAHTNHAKNVRLSDKWPAQNNEKGALKVIRPVAFYDSVDCPGRTSHIYANVLRPNGSDAICNNCGYNRLEVRTQWIEPSPVNSTLTLMGTSNMYGYRFAMKVTKPDGSIDWLDQKLDAVSISNQYTFTQRGLYEITVQCRDKNPDLYNDSVVVSNTVQVRIY